MSVKKTLSRALLGTAGIGGIAGYGAYKATKASEPIYIQKKANVLGTALKATQSLGRSMASTGRAMAKAPQTAGMGGFAKGFASKALRAGGSAIAKNPRTALGTAALGGTLALTGGGNKSEY